MIEFIFTPESFQLDPSCVSTTGEDKKWEAVFKENKYQGLFQLGFEEKGKTHSLSMNFLQRLSEEFLKALTEQPELEIAREALQVKVSEEAYQQIKNSVHFGIGTENINRQWIEKIFTKLNEEYSRQIEKFSGSVGFFLTEKSQELRVPERIFFHLVENKEGDYPFAFLATYATKDEEGRVRHMPLKYALTEFKEEGDKLLSLLSCLNKAGEASVLIGELVEKGELFHPLGLTSQEAYEFLKAIPEIKAAGIMCRIPNWWKKQGAKVSLTVRLGEKKASMLGFETLISMEPKLLINGEVLTKAEIKKLLNQTEGLALLKGRWIEVDHKALKKLLDDMEKYQGEITFRKALQLELEASKDKSVDVGPVISNGKWLGNLLGNLRSPVDMKTIKAPQSFCGTLRPYQKTGYTWLNYMENLGFGACLADDMGLGKTVQILAYLEKLRIQNREAKVLLIVPASLLGNWQKEAEKFAPKMEIRILHGKTAKLLGEELKASEAFVNVTTYGMALRVKALGEIEWDCLILDEAQAIKNPGNKQTKAIKEMKAKMRIAMTGTPIENDLTNLWSLYDFLNKGLLGSFKEFQDFAKGLEERPEGYSKLKAMISPFILRRVKTDKQIITDLPEKIEQIEYVGLSKKQIVLYKKQISELETKIRESEGIERKGLVLSTIVKLKQICNHPDQFLGEKAFSPPESGKFQILKEICETIYEKRERVLIFTQFKEITEDLANYLESIFKCKGRVLHGGTKISKRSEMVEEFNGEDYVPFMVLSVKAGGTGLNLVGANHVIHFDRWWNPAVENQATDRAYRIGQEKNVMVHKLVCEGTIEEKIDAMINQKKALAENIIGSVGEGWLTELSDAELLSMMRLK